MASVLRSPRGDSSGQGIPRHTRGSADRCSLPGLAGLADSRRVGPSPHRHSSGLNSTHRHLGRGFRLAGADCEYRAPLPPRLARPRSITLGPTSVRWAWTRFPDRLAERMAEREGFEPSTRLLDVYTISSRAPSAARAPLPVPADARSATPGDEENGGGGGIRTHVGAHHPQLDFESSPVRPLRYPSARRVRKNSCTRPPASAASTPAVTRTSWFHEPASSTRARLTTAPAFSSRAPKTSSATRACTHAPAHIRHGSTVTYRIAPGSR